MLGARGLKFLLDQRHRMRDLAQVDRGAVHLEQQMMEQRLAPARIHLGIDGGEIRAVLDMGFADVQDGEPALLESGRHLPILITGHQQPRVVGDPKRFFAFELDRMFVAGDQVFQLAFGLLVAGPKAFVGM